MILLTPLLLSFLVSSASALPSIRQTSSPTVSASGYTYVGASVPESNQEQFLGIPFAQPPVGSKRLRPPEALSKGNGSTISVTRFGASCIQPSIESLPVGPIDEDCLTLNIYRPQGVDSGANLPVLFWIYGGAFEVGSTVFFDATGLVAHSSEIGKPMIYVSANYRLGPLGFMPSAELAAEGSLNLGYLDQRMALEWVRDNIGQFGGDPKKVTVFGESAGAASVSHQMLYNGGNQDDLLFRGAIMESGGPTTHTIRAPDDPRSQELFDGIVKKANCTPSKGPADYSSTLECLRAAPLESFSLPNVVFKYGPTADGKFLTTTPVADIRAGKYANIPFISGTNRDEGTYFLEFALPSNITFDTTEDLIKFGNNELDAYNAGFDGGEVLRYYPEDPAAGAPFGVGGNSTFGWGQQGRRQAALMTDMLFVAPRRIFLEAASQKQAVYGYNFAAVAKGTPESLGSFHSAEIPWIYLSPNITSIPAQATLARTMADYWINFAADLNPNSASSNNSLPHWPEYNEDPAGALINFDIGSISTITDDFRKEGIQYLIDHTP